MFGNARLFQVKYFAKVGIFSEKCKYYLITTFKLTKSIDKFAQLTLNYITQQYINRLIMHSHTEEVIPQNALNYIMI